MTFDPDTLACKEREHLYQAIQGLPGIAHAHELVENDGDVDAGDLLPEGAMLRGFVVCAEFVGPGENFWFVQRSGGADGGDLVPWVEKGLLGHGRDRLG